MTRSLVALALLAQGALGSNRGDCHKGCKDPVQSATWANMSYADCLHWFQMGCRNDIWPGDSKQLPFCNWGQNAVAYSSHLNLCRAWRCDPDNMDYDGDASFSCVLNPSKSIPPPTLPAAKAYYPALPNTCLKNDPATELNDLNGVMTPSQAAKVCASYQDGSTLCQGYWWDSKSPQPTSAPTAKSAPCNIGIKTITEGKEWSVTGLTGGLDGCFLQNRGDKRQDSIGGCGYQGHDDWCCQNYDTSGNCQDANIQKNCGHITTEDGKTFSFETCGNDPSSFNAGAHFTAQEDPTVANGYLTCSDATCEIKVYDGTDGPYRYQYYFYNKFQPVSPDQCDRTPTGESPAALQSSVIPKLPYALQQAYHFVQQQQALNVYKTESTNYAQAQENCMNDENCWTFDWTCETNGQEHPCQGCRFNPLAAPNGALALCPDKFPGLTGSVKISYSSTTQDGLMGKASMSSFSKSKQLHASTVTDSQPANVVV